MKNEDYEKLFHEALKSNGKLLKGYSNFHRYSFSNQFWAMAQMIWAGLEISPIATYKKWQELGRQVKKGSKALTLYMPIQIKGEKADGTEEKKTVFVARNKWFALSQTEGDDNSEELQDYLKGTNFDWELALKELNLEKIPFDLVAGNVQGFARKGQVAVNPLAEFPVKTLIHEIAHNLLHLEQDGEFIDGGTTERSIKEVEAEGVALFVSLALGLEKHIPYCVGYIKNWLQVEEIPADSIKKIFRAANKILRAGQVKEVAAREA